MNGGRGLKTGPETGVGNACGGLLVLLLLLLLVAVYTSMVPPAALVAVVLEVTCRAPPACSITVKDVT